MHKQREIFQAEKKGYARRGKEGRNRGGAGSL